MHSSAHNVHSVHWVCTDQFADAPPRGKKQLVAAFPDRALERKIIVRNAIQPDCAQCAKCYLSMHCVPLAKRAHFLKKHTSEKQCLVCIKCAQCARCACTHTRLFLDDRVSVHLMCTICTLEVFFCAHHLHNFHEHFLQKNTNV